MPPHELPFPEDALPETLAWSGRPGANELTPLPGCAAVFLFVNDRGAPVQLATTQHLKRAAGVKLGEYSEPRRGKVDLAEIVRGVRWRRVHSPFEARWWYYRLIRGLHPRTYLKELTFGPAWFLHVDWSAPIPDVQVSERIWRVPGEFVGPWPTRKACRQALETLWDLFDLCRYPEQVRKTPDGTPCAYAEMNRCDAPCDGSVPLGDYVSRVRAAWGFATGALEAWMTNASARMQTAAAALRFEQAALLKQQLAAARHWQTQWSEQTRTAENLNYLVAIPATRRKAWKPFFFHQGFLVDGPLLPEGRLTRALPNWLDEQWRHVAAAQAPGGEPAPDYFHADNTARMEQTWLLAHFLQYKESRSAIAIPLVPGEMPPDIAARIEERLRAVVHVESEAALDVEPPSP